MNELQLINKTKLDRINCPETGVQEKILVFDEYHPFSNQYVNVLKTNSFEDGEKLGVHGLFVANVIKAINPKSIVYGQSFTHDFMQVVDFAIDNNIRVINTSISTSYKESRDKAIKKYYEWGGIWVAGAGNFNDKEVTYPASSKYTIGVSATNTEDSNGQQVDTTADSWWSVFGQKGRRRSFNGTSASSPVIASVAQYYIHNNINGNLDTFRNWINMNEMDDLDKVLDYKPPFGKLEDGEEFFVFPDELIDKEADMEVENKTVIKIYPNWSQSSGKFTYKINNQIKSMDVKPKIENGRTFVPIRFVAEALGCEVEWNEEKGEVKIIK